MQEQQQEMGVAAAHTLKLISVDEIHVHRTEIQGAIYLVSLMTFLSPYCIREAKFRTTSSVLSAQL
jgi:hypothetical protein